MGVNLFKNKYRIQSTRLPGWNYAGVGYYFVTICTKNRETLFGDIVNEKMILNNLGRIADKFWRAIPEHFPQVILDEYIIMPNHIHGIIEINWDRVKRKGYVLPSDIETQNFVETQNFASLQMRQSMEHKNIFGPQSKNLSSIIRGFKIGVKKWAVINNIYFGWQPRFYDRIIRNDQSMKKARTYILDNPFKWPRDGNNPQGLGM